MTKAQRAAGMGILLTAIEDAKSIGHTLGPIELEPAKANVNRYIVRCSCGYATETQTRKVQALWAACGHLGDVIGEESAREFKSRIRDAVRGDPDHSFGVSPGDAGALR